MSERTMSGRGEQSGTDGAAHLHAAQEKEYRALANEWHRETDHHSSTSIIQSHAALQKIVRMGAPAVPLILRELNEGRDGHWFQALRTLTGENPVAKDSSYDACRAAWLAWGRKRADWLGT
jgi:hypothetical protein